MTTIVVNKIRPVINHDHYRGHQSTTRHKSRTIIVVIKVLPVINHDHKS